MGATATYAGGGVRFVAALIDALILGVIQVILSMVLGGGISSLTDPNAAQSSGATMVNVLSWVISIGYYVGYQGSTGQTLGKKVMGIRVVNLSGVKPGYGTFFLREIIGKFVSAIILLIGYLMILWDAKKQGLHDKIAGTVVVKV